MWFIKYPNGPINPISFPSVRSARKYLCGGWGRIHTTVWVNDKQCIVNVYREGVSFVAYIQKID